MDPKKAEQVARLRRSLTHHRPSEGAVARIAIIRAEAIRLGETVVLETPTCREQSLALTHLEEAVMWAVKAIVLEAGEPA